MVLAYLKSANRAGPKLYVRVNALDTGLTLGDLAVVMQGKPDGIVFPKCVGQANVDLLATYLDALEAREGIEAGATRILTIATESAAAVLALTAAPARHARLIGHSWGGEDLMADLGALAKGPSPGEYDDTFRLARTVNLMASVAAGITAYDTVYPDIKNVAGLRAEATDARRMGYGGKIAIHPDQVAIIHEVFTPTAQEVDWAEECRRDVRKQSRLRRADARRQDAGQAAPDAGASAARPDGWMKDNFGLLSRRSSSSSRATGSRYSRSTSSSAGCTARSYAFAIAALNVPNCIPTGIPWLSTITGLPMVFLLVQFFARPRGAEAARAGRPPRPAARQAAGSSSAARVAASDGSRTPSTSGTNGG